METNNHECCISWDGDIEPMKIVISLFGEERASEVQRQCNRECLSVERIVELMKNDLA